MTIKSESQVKLYADKKRIRIIYEEIDHIVKIIAIDKREDMEVYRIALKRILSMKSESWMKILVELIGQIVE